MTFAWGSSNIPTSEIAISVVTFYRLILAMGWYKIVQRKKNFQPVYGEDFKTKIRSTLGRNNNSMVFTNYG